MFSKKNLFLQASILLTLSGCWFNNKSNTPNRENSQHGELKKDSSTIEITTEAQFENLLKEETKPLVVDFEAPWCGACRDLKPLIIDAASKETSYTFVRVNVDTVPNLGKQYNIVGIPTLIFIKNGKELTDSRIIGPDAKNSSELLTQIQKAFSKADSTNPTGQTSSI